MEAMMGMIFMLPFDWAPDGYQKCQGQIMSVQQYTALYSLVGATYGGNGQTTFGLPNLQGRAPIGTGTLQGGAQYPLAQQLGSEKTTLALGNLPAHNHGATFTPVTGSQSITIPAQTGNLAVQVNASTVAASAGAPSSSTVLAAGPGTTKIYGPATSTTALAGEAATLTGSASTAAQNVNITTVTSGSVAVGITGTGTPFSSFQPSLALTFVIAVQGLYPSRP